MTYKEYIEKNKDKFLTEVSELLKIPSISSQSEHKADVLKCAEFLKDHLTQIGLKNSQVMKTGGHPIVYADLIVNPARPTFLIYGHYDVQAPDPLNEWKTPPFDPTVKDGNIYARGTADDKCQFFIHLKAIESLLKTEKEFPINIKILLEGEEEIGGVSLDKFIDEHKDLLKADVCLISDSNALSETQPMICYGLRGIVYFQIDLSVLDKDVHSGTFGGNVPNASTEASSLISKLKDANTQKVNIDGFYDNVRTVNAEERELLKASPFNDEFFKDHTGAKKLSGLWDYSPAERMGTQPTLDVNGISSGYTGEGAKTIIPSKASIKLSMRLVPNQTVAEIQKKFVSYVEKIIPNYVSFKVTTLSTGEPIIMDVKSPYFAKANEILEKKFGNKPVYELAGGSIPVTASIKNTLGIDSVMLGFGLPDDGLHSPNEKMSLNMFYKGIDATAEYYLSFKDQITNTPTVSSKP